MNEAMMATDPWAAIRQIGIGYTPGGVEYGYGDGGQRFEQPYDARYMPTLPEGWGGKYQWAFRPEGAPEGTVQVTGIQQPGAHKYDTLSATYRLDPATGQYVLVGDPWATRETSSADRFQDFAEKGSLLVGSVLGAGYLGSQYLGAEAGMGVGAGSGNTLTPALMESSLGTAGYGASSAGMGGGSAVLGGVGAGGTAGAGSAGGAMAQGSIASSVPTASVSGMNMAPAAMPSASVAGNNAAMWRAGSSLAGNVLSSYMQGNAAQDASAAQQAAAAQGQASLKGVYDRIAELMQPYVGAGVTALDAQQALIGQKGPEAQKLAIAALEQSPEFASTVRQGEEAILANASATGGLRGGNVQAALSKFRPQVLAELINQQYSRLSGLSQQGQNAAAGVGNAGVSIGGGIANLRQQQGAAAAGGALARGQTSAGYVSAISNAIGLYYGLKGG
ncbi:MAG: hypothetical protein ACRC1H_05000 [Caldilineaceae bacterium]